MRHEITNKNKALAFYVIGKAPAEIASLTGIPASTIAGWVHKLGWDQLRKETSIVSQGKVVGDVSDILADNTKRHLRIYKKMQTRGEEELDERPARSAGEAGDLADRGIRGERGVISGLVSRKLISLLAQIITEEITDVQVRQRVAMRLKDVLNAEAEV